MDGYGDDGKEQFSRKHGYLVSEMSFMRLLFCTYIELHLDCKGNYRALTNYGGSFFP